jgi:putative peptidoglycan lipid II flippase
MDGRRLARTYGKLILASAGAGALGWAAARAGGEAAPTGTVSTALALAAGGVTMTLGYLIFARLLRISELGMLPLPGLRR